MDGVSTASRLQTFRGGSLLFATKFPEVPGTQFIDPWRMGGGTESALEGWVSYNSMKFWDFRDIF